MKKSGNEHPDVMRQQRFPLPGTDLGSLNARPMDFVPDVDGESTNYPPQFSFSVPGKVRRK